MSKEIELAFLTLLESAEIKPMSNDFFERIEALKTKAEQKPIADLIAQAEADKAKYPLVWWKAWEYFQDGDWCKFMAHNMVTNDGFRYRRHPNADTILQVELDKIDHAGYWWEMWQIKSIISKEYCKLPRSFCVESDFEYRPHPHRDNIIKYHACSDEDKNRWQWKEKASLGWIDRDGKPEWLECHEYRLRPRTFSVTVNGTDYEFPEPCREPLKDGQIFFVISIGGVSEHTWKNETWQNEWLKKRWIHLTKEAAEQHLLALQAVNMQVAL